MKPDQITLPKSFNAIFPGLMGELHRCAKYSVDTTICWRCGRLLNLASDAWLHILYPTTGVSVPAVIEAKLDIRLPSMYRDFLTAWNGASLFHGDIDVWGVYLEKVEKRYLPAYDIIEQNLQFWMRKLFPPNQLAVANQSTGEIVVIYLESGMVEEIDPSISAIASEKWPSFAEWLDEQIAELVVDWEVERIG